MTRNYPHPFDLQAMHPFTRDGHLLMTAYFLYAAYVQQNDNDAPIWITFYVSAAIVCLWSSVNGKAQAELNFAVIAVALGLLGKGFIAAGNNLELTVHTEIGRETLGLLICVVWMLFTSTGIVPPLILLFAAAGVCASVYGVPKYLMTSKDVNEQCAGLGVAVGKP